jgi:hypothetical protein
MRCYSRDKRQPLGDAARQSKSIIRLRNWPVKAVFHNFCYAPERGSALFQAFCLTGVQQSIGSTKKNGLTALPSDYSISDHNQRGTKGAECEVPTSTGVSAVD